MFDDGNKQALEAECAGFRRMVKKGRGFKPLLESGHINSKVDCRVL